MTSGTVIDVRQLSKGYELGVAHHGVRTLRETLPLALKSQLRRFLTGAGSISLEDNHIWALKDVSFRVKKAELVGLLGPNGAGKSTLLKILSRITYPTTGYADVRGRVGSLLELGTGFHPDLTGRENIYLNGVIIGMKRAEIDRKLDQIVAFAEVQQFLDTPVKFYSSGMYLRLAFAVAAHLDTDILLLDEVLAVGDHAFQKKCLARMTELIEGGKTILFVSHNLEAMKRLCKRGIYIQHGQIAYDGGISEAISCYLQPAATKRT